MSEPARRRFCLVTTFFPPFSFGGDAIYVRDLARELAARGHDVHVVHNVDAYRALARSAPAPTAAPEPPNLTVHRLRSRAGWLELLLMHQLGRPVLHARRLRRLLNQRFDVLHYHNVSLMGGPKILEYGTGLKLYTTHEAWIVCPTHTLFRFDRAPCVRPHCVLCTLSYRRPPQWWRYSSVGRDAWRYVDAFLSPSRSNTVLHRERGAELPFVELPNFVPDLPGELERETEGLEESAGPYFLYVGRLERLKGPQTLLPVFRQFRQARLVVAGAGSQEANLRRAAEGSAVTFLGQVEPWRLSRLYRNAVAVIVPSLCQESFGLVALEAFRERTPIVARDRGALSQIVAESGGGLLYRDDHELVSALRRLSADRALRDELGEVGWRAYRERWTADVHVGRYLDLVERMLRERRRSDDGIAAERM